MVAGLRRREEFKKKSRMSDRGSLICSYEQIRDQRSEISDFDIFEPNKGFILPKGASFIFTAFNDERTGF